MPIATPEELLKHPAPELPIWIRERKLLPNPEYQFQFLRPPTKAGKSGGAYWTSNYGPQTWGLVSPFAETVCGGSRGGGKSALLIAWFAVGYPMLPHDDPAHYLSILEPSYRGLMLRREYQSMAEFVDEAWDFYGPLGATKKDDPVVFTFKSGAKIYTNHLGDKNAFEKYRGWGISRIGIEELTQIEEERWYLKLLGSLRAKRQVRMHGNRQFPALPSQIMSTTNPDGPGAAWVKKRFIKVVGGDGKYIPWNMPMRDTITGSTRIFIPMTRKENPYLRDNKEYESNLLAQDEVTRRQWMLGDWDASSGTYFLEFRPHGPIGTEEQNLYPWARHVISPVELKPWWWRAGGGDWGYEHPATFHKICRSDKDGRLHVYDELSLRHCGSFEMGVELANWWLPDLEFLPDKTITIALSPDAFSKTDASRTKAEQMAEGIKRVLGPYGAFLLKFSDDERALMSKDSKLAQTMFDRRRSEHSQGQLNIVLKAANTNRVDGWSYMREQLRFRPIVQESELELKQRLVKTYSQAGIEAYERELAKVKRAPDAALPKLQIWKTCPQLIRSVEEAMKDEDKPEDVRKYDAVEGVGGDDALDSLRHALMDFKEIETRMPKSYFVSQKIEEIQSQYETDTGERITDPTRLVMIAQRQAARYDVGSKQHTRGFSMPRASSSRHRR